MPSLVLIGPAVRPAIARIQYIQTDKHIAFYYVDNYHLCSEGGIVFSSVCLSVCLFVYQHQDNSWNVRDIITEFSGNYPMVEKKTSICIARLMYKTPLTRICVTETEPPGRLFRSLHSLQTQPCAVTQQPAVGLHLSILVECLVFFLSIRTCGQVRKWLCRGARVVI